MAIAVEVMVTEALRGAWQRAAEEILGPDHHVVSAAQPVPWRGATAALSARYGETAGAGVGVRLGRAFARHLIPAFAEEAGCDQMDFRFLPWPRKMAVGMERLCLLAQRWFAVPARVEVQAEAVVWRFAECPFGMASAGGCVLWQGFLQELLYWLSGGRWFAVEVDDEAPLLRVPRRPLH